MKALVQRVLWAEVETCDTITGRIGRGLLVYVAAATGDTSRDATDLAEKIVNLRIFQDQQGKINRTLRDVGGRRPRRQRRHACCRRTKGNPPRHGPRGAGGGGQAACYEQFVAALKSRTQPVECGDFGVSMIVRCAGDGPVNVIVDVPPESHGCGSRPVAAIEEK